MYLHQMIVFKLFFSNDLRVSECELNMRDNRRVRKEIIQKGDVT